MRWFFWRGWLRCQRKNGKLPRSIRKAAYLDLEPLEDRRLFTNDVWLPRQLVPLEGNSGLNQNYQQFRSVLGDLMPRFGMSLANVTLSGNFTFTVHGSYSFSYSEQALEEAGTTFFFNVTGTSTFSLTEGGTLGTVSRNADFGFSFLSTVLTQTLSMSWTEGTVAQLSHGNHTTIASQGNISFTESDAPPSPFAPYFWDGLILVRTGEKSHPEGESGCLGLELDGNLHHCRRRFGYVVPAPILRPRHDHGERQRAGV